MKRLLLLLSLVFLAGQALAADFTMTSLAFEQGKPIPKRYTCDGVDHSPFLEWDGAPKGTVSFALIMDDPDAPAGVWVHWVLFNIPGTSMGLPEAVPALPKLNDGSAHGNNSWPKLGYGGPCPPTGKHRYFFKLYALDARLDLKPGADKAAVLQAMEGHILGTAELMGIYSR